MLITCNYCQDNERKVNDDELKKRRNNEMTKQGHTTYTRLFYGGGIQNTNGASTKNIE